MLIKKRRNIIIISLALAVLFLACVYLFCGIWFETNDDVAISEFLAGKIMGKPDYHCPYVKSFITWPISRLYVLNNEIPWWGILITIALFMVLFVNLYSVLTLAKNLYEAVFILIIEMAIFVAGIHCFGQAQYTAVAILMAFTGYVVIISSIARNSRPAWVIFFACELLACGMRDSSMILVQPIGLMSLLGMSLFYANNREEYKRAFNKIICAGCIAICVLAVSKIDKALTFHNAEWKEYIEYNDARTLLMDYEKPIPYGSVGAVLEKYGITSEDYNQMLSHRVAYMDNKFSKECVDELLPILRDLRARDNKNGNWRAGFLQLLFTSSEFWHMHQLVTICIFVPVLFSLLYKKKKTLMVSVTLILGYLIEVGALAYRNRFVLRVMLPFYLGTLLLTFLLLILTIKEVDRDEAKKKRIVVWGIIPSLVFVIFALQIGRVQFSYVRAQNRHVNAIRYSETQEIVEYCREHQDNHYLLDMSYLRYTNTDIFERDFYKSGNYVYSGSWNSNSPYMMSYCKNYLTDGFYCMVYEAQEFLGEEGPDYYASLMNTEKELTEKVKLMSGATIWVYRIK